LIEKQSIVIGAAATAATVAAPTSIDAPQLRMGIIFVRLGLNGMVAGRGELLLIIDGGVSLHSGFSPNVPRN